MRPSFVGLYLRFTFQVNRPGVTILYRHGYYADPTLAPFDRRRLVTTGRVASAARYTQDVHDIPLKATISQQTARQLEATVTIDATPIAFTQDGRLRTASVELALFAVDAGDRPVGQIWKTVALTFTEDRYQEMLRAGVPVNVTVPLTAPARRVKIVAYDYGSDRVGSLLLKLQ